MYFLLQTDSIQLRPQSINLRAFTSCLDVKCGLLIGRIFLEYGPIKSGKPIVPWNDPKDYRVYAK